jgi:hypothetical protein
MLAYGDWLKRAIAFVHNVRALPGEIELETEVAPPFSDQEIQEFAQACRLPLPEPLRRFWITASRHCHCTYSWETPRAFHKQLLVAFDDSTSFVSGGPNFESPEYVLSIVNDNSWDDETWRTTYPKDSRYWEWSFPLLPFGNGDYIGLYVRENPTNPPVVVLCHDGCGASGVIAPDFDQFLILWERLGYIWIHRLYAFINQRTGLLDPDSFPGPTEALDSLLRGEARADLVRPNLTFTEDEWSSSDDARTMLTWLEHSDKLDDRKYRLFACACCRRIWNRMSGVGRQAIEIAEKYVDGLASTRELNRAAKDLTGMWDKTAFPIVAGGFLAWETTWEIRQHLDEPELSVEKAAHADLVRHIFGSPFQLNETLPIMRVDVLRLAKRQYAGENCAAELHRALNEAGEERLAEHFLRLDHPKGCWALDCILGR